MDNVKSTAALAKGALKQAEVKAYLQAIAVGFEPGDEKQVKLIALVGSRHVYGLGGEINGNL